MARKLRVEYPGAIYHVLNRGDRGKAIFRDGKDRLRFLEALAEACGKTGWQVHAYCLMPNEFHLVVETPRANLVTGMKWFMGAYTARFNRRHEVSGNLFTGRYKALIVDGSSHGYLRTVCDYVHLNPARDKKVLTPGKPLRTYPWSSYGEYLNAPARRVKWLRVDRLLGEMGIAGDSAAGRRQFELQMEERRQRAEPGEWKSVRRGWCLGDKPFRKELLKRMGQPMERQYNADQERQKTEEARAERILVEELRRRKWRANDLARRRKGDKEKVKIAMRLRAETTVTLDWIAERLAMGVTAYVAFCLHEAKVRKPKL